MKRYKIDTRFGVQTLSSDSQPRNAGIETVVLFPVGVPTHEWCNDLDTRLPAYSAKP
jgi:hypothetical protein